jgi:hypothetical protein
MLPMVWKAVKTNMKAKPSKMTFENFRSIFSCVGPRRKLNQWIESPENMKSFVVENVWWIFKWSNIHSCASLCVQSRRSVLLFCFCTSILSLDSVCCFDFGLRTWRHVLHRPTASASFSNQCCMHLWSLVLQVASAPTKFLRRDRSLVSTTFSSLTSQSPSFWKQ